MPAAMATKNFMFRAIIAFALLHALYVTLHSSSRCFINAAGPVHRQQRILGVGMRDGEQDKHVHWQEYEATQIEQALAQEYVVGPANPFARDPNEVVTLHSLPNPFADDLKNNPAMHFNPA